VEDALSATRAAVEEGIVAGGGVALLRARESLDSLKVSDDQEIGVDIIRSCLSAPLTQIANNSGEEGAVIVEKVLSEKNIATGYNAANGKIENLVDAGVVDPTKVVRSALQNAASVAALMLTTEVLVSDEPEEDKGGMPGMPHGGMGGMGGGMPGMM